MNNPFWSPALAELEPYVPGEQPRGNRLIKLNTNENPYPPSTRAMEALADPQLADALRRYPDPESTELCATIAAQEGLAPEQVFVGNGSDEVLAHTFYSFFRRGADEPLLYPEITYSFYPVYCQLYGIPHRSPALREDFSIAVEDYAGPAAGVILPNPNAPTGRYLALEQIERLLELQPERVVAVDEAYIEFGGESAAGLIGRYPNLLVIRTLSKSHALAGLRLGYALGQPHLVEGLQRTKNSFNSYPIDSIAQRMAAAAIADTAWLRDTRERVIATRERVARELEALDFEVVPSMANFLLARPRAIGAESLYLQLRERQILVRYFNKPRLSDYLRISIGTDSEMDALLAACREIQGTADNSQTR
ncbi:histidinol-phosphate transaminase [Microbulbifer yueqingensis]|uniref:Histidinol-phosphate aminotransferase n=1 Tax=Microbulbifer yueqingensis TaxID=658219 RepID=A0A1G8XYB7_9GAMM|nr:histidinol-phosphate transaminase [Microbulbifer yueqingensis]SDJ95174.1 histidinol-phosphate aminotransferase [Microbulbifer yueqingensis]